MNEEKKAPSQNTMQDAIQHVLPDDLKKKFVLEKNSSGQPNPGSNPLASQAPSTPKVDLDPNMVQKPIRTFESDLAAALRKKQGSAATISIAESKKKEEESRKAELAAKMAAAQAQIQKEEPVIVRPTATAPTRSTAIPGATIDLPPSVPRSEVRDEITAALNANRPKEIPVEKPYVPPAMVKPITPVAPPVAAIKVPISTPTQVETPRQRTPILKPILLTLTSLILISAGVFGGFLFYTQMTEKQKAVPIVAPIAIPGIIPSDSEKSITVGAEGGNQIITRIYAEINRTTLDPGQNIALTINEGTTPITGTRFIEKLGTNIPSVISRSLTDRWMLGVYGEDNGQKTTYLALTTDFFQNAFAGMLIWEDNGLADDFALLLNYRDKAYREDLSSSTPSTYFSIRGNYSDRVLRNRDVREFRNNQGELLFLYSFVNKETLIITTTESSFMALVDRIEKEAYVR